MAIGTKFGPLYFMTRYENQSNAIATPYEQLTVADGPNLPANFRCQNISKFKFSVILAVSKSHKYLDECFLKRGINRPFTVNKDFLILSQLISMTLTAAMRISSCRELLASILRPSRCLVRECTDKSVHSA